MGGGVGVEYGMKKGAKCECEDDGVEEGRKARGKLMEMRD